MAVSKSIAEPTHVNMHFPDLNFIILIRIPRNHIFRETTVVLTSGLLQKEKKVEHFVCFDYLSGYRLEICQTHLIIFTCEFGTKQAINYQLLLRLLLLLLLLARNVHLYMHTWLKRRS